MGNVSLGRRVLLAGGAVLAAAAASFVGVPTSSAAPGDLPISQNVTANTHLASLNQDLTNTGTFTGVVNLGTGSLTGDLSLGATETELALVGLPLAKVGVQVVPTGPTVGHIDFSTFAVTNHADFNIKIVYVKPLGLFNIVGKNCQTSSPVSLDMTGSIDPATLTTTLAGEFEIPQFANCGLATIGLNLLVPGSGNTFSSVATPA